MTPLALAAILSLAILLAAVSAVAGALWWRLRSMPLVEAVRLARTLAARRRALEDLLERVEAASRVAEGSGDAAPVAAPKPARRVERRAAEAPPPPKLIAVPDLAATPSPLEEDLADRFGVIWGLADSGAPPDAIAREIGQPVGQVELILGLRRQLAQAGPIGARR